MMVASEEPTKPAKGNIIKVTAVPVKPSSGDIISNVYLTRIGDNAIEWGDGFEDGFRVRFNLTSNTIEMRCEGMSSSFLFSQSPEGAYIQSFWPFTPGGSNLKYNFNGIALLGIGYNPSTRDFYLVLSNEAVNSFGELGKLDGGVTAWNQHVGHFKVISEGDFGKLDKTGINFMSPGAVLPVFNITGDRVNKELPQDTYYDKLQPAERAYIDKQAEKYGGAEEIKEALAKAMLFKGTFQDRANFAVELGKALNIDAEVAYALITQLKSGLAMVAPEQSSKVTSRIIDIATQISEDLPLRAQVLKANLNRILTEHSDQLFFIGIENDIGESQKAQIMPLYKAIDEIKELKDASGKPLFPNLMIRRGKADELVSTMTELSKAKTISHNGIEFGTLDLNRAFIGARKLSVDKNLYDSIKGEGKAWISAIDDSRPGDYLPVFEAITVNMMAYLNADLSAIQNFYNTISDKPIDPTALQDMIRNRVIYILPRATKFDEKQLRTLYELAQQVYVAA